MTSVTPAKAGVPLSVWLNQSWIPAFAGMTEVEKVTAMHVVIGCLPHVFTLPPHVRLCHQLEP